MLTPQGRDDRPVHPGDRPRRAGDEIPTTRASRVSARWLIAQCRAGTPGRGRPEPRPPTAAAVLLSRHHEALFHETRYRPRSPGGCPGVPQRQGAGGFRRLRPGRCLDVWPLPRTFSQQEQAGIGDVRYEPSWVLGEAVAQTLPGEDRVLQANCGRDLDQASGLSRSPFHRAWCCATSASRGRGTRPAAARERAAADRLRPTTVLDHYLAGRGACWCRPKTALSESGTVPQAQPDHFWSLCLGAIAAIQMNQPALAKLGLNAASQEPRFAWLYMLRGFATCQVSAVEARVSGSMPKIEDRSELKRPWRSSSMRRRRRRQGARARRCNIERTSAGSRWSTAP